MKFTILKLTAFAMLATASSSVYASEEDHAVQKSLRGSTSASDEDSADEELYSYGWGNRDWSRQANGQPWSVRSNGTPYSVRPNGLPWSVRSNGTPYSVQPNGQPWWRNNNNGNGWWNGNSSGGGGGPRAACQFIPVRAGCAGNPFCNWVGGQCVPAMADASDIEGDSEDFDLESEDPEYEFEEGGYDEVDEDGDWDADVSSAKA